MYNALKKVTDNVEVQVITNAPQSGANPWGCADYLNHRDDILETGVDICEWNGSFSMHTKTILIDDPIQCMDDINMISFVELLRREFSDCQIILSTHEENFSNFIRYKFKKYGLVAQAITLKDA